ncbi:MAG TPA: hypothetical protein VF170_10340 [Planctomycetaceae bacterium]
MPRPSGQAAGGATLEEAWHVLCESVRDCAEGYAATDPSNAYLYRRDAEWFCDKDAPRNDEELLDRHAQAAGLRESWGALFVTNLRRRAR